MSAVQRHLDLANLRGHQPAADLNPLRANARSTDESARRVPQQPALEKAVREHLAVSAHVLGEAQSCGVPVVADDAGGLSDAVEHDRAGLLVDAFSVESLASAVVALLSDDEKRLAFGSAARARAEALWSPSVIAKQYLAVYAQAIDPCTSDSTFPSGGSVTPSKATTR